MEENGLSQAIALRMHYLPNADDSDLNLARAIWLDKHYFENLHLAVAAGVAKAFNPRA